MTKTDVVIEINNLTKDYEVGFWKKRTVRALDQLSLTVLSGEIFGFLGPNGAGKTTTLKLLMRLLYPTNGTIRILGQPIDNLATRSLIGYLPENPYFYDYLSGRELLEYSAALFCISKTDAKVRAEELLDLVGLERERANRQLRKYSKGMLQRIGIAQALINDPEIVFMDEPMSGLDPIGRREVRDLILRLREKNKTVFFSSHILSDVEALCDRAAILNRGRLVGCGTVQELTDNVEPAFEIIALGINERDYSNFSRSVPEALSISITPQGVQLLVKDESSFTQTIEIIHQFKGRVVSITPRRSSLEDFFAIKE
jgi:ABC-2 type transport system ATP-binding protein